MMLIESIQAPTSREIRVERLRRRLVDLVASCRQEETPAESIKIRDEAQAEYQRAVNEFIDRAKREAANRRHKQEAMVALFLLLMLRAGRKTHARVTERLGRINRPKKRLSDRALNRQSGEFAQDRQKHLRDFPAAVVERLSKVAGKCDLTKIELADLTKEADAIKTGQGKVVARTEAQATIGNAHIGVLRRAGFTTAIWNQLDRPTKRDSHEINAELGARPLGFLYPNGQRYPGDPAGGAGECINCECFLEGVAI